MCVHRIHCRYAVYTFNMCTREMIWKYKEIIIHNLNLEECISSHHYLKSSLCHRCGSLRHCTRHYIFPTKKQCNLSWVQPMLRKNELEYNIPSTVRIKNVKLVKCVNNINIFSLQIDRETRYVCNQHIIEESQEQVCFIRTIILLLFLMSYLDFLNFCVHN